MKYCLWGDEVFILELLSIVGFISSVNFYVFSVFMCKIYRRKAKQPWACLLKLFVDDPVVLLLLYNRKTLSFILCFVQYYYSYERNWMMSLGCFFLKLVQDRMYKKVKYCMFTFNFHNDWHFFAIKHDRSFVRYVECFNKICNYFKTICFCFVISKYISRKWFLWRDWLAVWNSCWHFTRRFQC